MLTGAGSGYSRWRDLAVTRWREDVTRDAWGSYIFLRDVDSGKAWSAGHQPTCLEADAYEVTFSEDRAQIVRRDGSLTTTLDVVVSAESDAEVRRVSISNTGSKTREIELTSYAELVLHRLPPIRRIQPSPSCSCKRNTSPGSVRSSRRDGDVLLRDPKSGPHTSRWSKAT